VSRLPEQRLWDRFSANMRHRPGLRMERVENLLAAGFPDVVVMARRTPLSRGRVAFVELKMVDAPPRRPTTPVLGEKKGLTQEQRNWHWLAEKFGVQTYILVGVGSAENYLLDGREADYVNSCDMSHLGARSSAYLWDDIYKELMGIER